MAASHWIWLTGLVVCSVGCRATGTTALSHSDRTDPVPFATTSTSGDAGPATPGAEISEETQLASHQEPLPAVAADMVASSELAPAGELSLDRSISLGLSQNPDLIALRQTEQVSAAALGVAETYPFNPFVQVQATPAQDPSFDVPETTYHYVLLMQTIQLARQQQFREAGAASALNSTRWNIHQAELLNVAQTARLYFSLLYVRGLQDLAEASHRNNRQLLRILEKQLEAGQANASDVAIVRIDERSTRQQLRLAAANVETALRDLKRQVGLPADEPEAVPGDLSRFKWRSPASVIPGSALSGTGAELNVEPGDEKYQIASRAVARPDVMAAHSDIDAARANLCLATASRTPDLQIGPYYQRTLDGSSFLGFRAQMDLPVVNSGKPLERQRAAELNQRATIWQQTARRAELEAQAAWERYKLAYAAVAEDAADSASDLPQELLNLEQQFLEGEVDVVRVVQARTSLIQGQRSRLDLLNELAQSAANLTAAAGMSVEELLR